MYVLIGNNGFLRSRCAATSPNVTRINERRETKEEIKAQSWKWGSPDTQTQQNKCQLANKLLPTIPVTLYFQRYALRCERAVQKERADSFNQPWLQGCPRGLSPVKAGGGSWEASPLAYRSLDSPNKTQKDCSLTSAKETAQPFHYSCTTSSMARGWLKAGDEYK